MLWKKEFFHDLGGKILFIFRSLPLYGHLVIHPVKGEQLRMFLRKSAGWISGKDHHCHGTVKWIQSSRLGAVHHHRERSHLIVSETHAVPWGRFDREEEEVNGEKEKAFQV